MSAYGLQLDAWLDDKLRAVPIPDGLTAKLRRIPGLVNGGVVDGGVLNGGVLNGGVLSDAQSLDAALAAVPLPGGLVDRLQATCGRVANGARRRDRMERTAVAAVLLLAIGGSYAASLAAFLWTSFPASRLAAAADQPRYFQGAFSWTEDFDGPTVCFSFADTDSPATRRVFNETVAAANLMETGPMWETKVVDDPTTSGPLVFASSDVNLAISEHLDRLWLQDHGRRGGQVLLSHVVPNETDDGCKILRENLTRWFVVRWAEWPGLWELAGYLDHLCEPADRPSGWDE